MHAREFEMVAGSTLKIGPGERGRRGSDRRHHGHRDLRRVAGPVRGDEVDRAAPDRVGRPVVGDRLERDLALDLKDVADLVEDPGEIPVGQVVAGTVIGVVVVVGVFELGIGRREVVGHVGRW